MNTDSALFSIGMMLFTDVTQLDFTGPYEVFARMPDTQVHILAPTLTPIRSERGLVIQPDTLFKDTPKLDLIFVPGGGGVNRMMEDQASLRFLREHAQEAQYVTAVCTGALVLGAAGLLRGYRATTHWLSMDLLSILGATPVNERVVIDRNRITGGGITAGIDFGLTVAQLVRGDEVAQTIQLSMEYNPRPPLQAGSPSTAPTHIVQSIQNAQELRQEERRKIAMQAATLFISRFYPIYFRE